VIRGESLVDHDEGCAGGFEKVPLLRTEKLGRVDVHYDHIGLAVREVLHHAAKLNIVAQSKSSSSVVCNATAPTPEGRPEDRPKRLSQRLP
jgi:hypothetical protein